MNLEIRYSDLYLRSEMTSVLIKIIENTSINIMLSFVTKYLHIFLDFKLMKLLFSFPIYLPLNKSDTQRSSGNCHNRMASKTW